MKVIPLLLVMAGSASSQEPTLESLRDAMIGKKEAFAPLALKGDGEVANLDLELGDPAVEFAGDTFDGFRFRCPEGIEGRDFVWYFNAPEHWGNWYIVPAEETPGDAFKGWLDGDKLYQPFDKTGEKNRLRVLQTLKGDYFKPGAEYLMWFRKVGNGEDRHLRGVAAFAGREDAWDHEAIGKALGLKEASAEDQVAGLSSRGGMILLDDRFFDPDYAAGRIDSAFYSIRSTRRTAGGFFVTTRISVPPCGTSPSFAAIVKEHGAPDFVRDSAEIARVRRHAGGKPDEDDEGVIRHHYDHFAFEVEAGGEDPKVVRVATQGADFSVLRPPAEGAAFAGVDIENLTVFHKDGKEVGRAYYFMEGGKEPLFITRPPAGDYRSGNQVLTSKGDGDWMWETRFPDGKPARRVPLEKDRMHGNAEGFQENGKPRFNAEYRDGELNGVVVEFDPEGAELSRRQFKDGEPQDE